MAKSKRNRSKGPPPTAGKMTPMQEAFIQEYLTCSNAAEAARRAGYSAKIARSLGQRLLTYPHVDAAIKAGQKHLAELAEVDAVEVRRETKHVAFGRIKTIAKLLGFNLDQLTDAEAACIASLKHGKYGLEVRLHNKVGALDLLSRQIGALAPEKHEVTVKLEDLSDEQLDDEIEQLAAEVQGEAAGGAAGEEAPQGHGEAVSPAAGPSDEVPGDDS